MEFASYASEELVLFNAIGTEVQKDESIHLAKLRNISRKEHELWCAMVYRRHTRLS